MPAARIPGQPVSKTPEYKAWISMKRRCFEPRYKGFQYWGGRGITVCEEWIADFFAFLAHIGAIPSPERCTVDRIDNDGHYEPGNVRWATKKEQQRNKARAHRLEYNGRTQTLAEWAEELGMPYNTLFGRIFHKKWTVEQAISLPVTWGSGPNRPRKTVCRKCGGELVKWGKARACRPCYNLWKQQRKENLASVTR